MLKNIPTWVKLVALFAFLLLGPSMVAAVMLGGAVAALFTGFVFLLIFMTLYFFFVRIYL